jgi:hypothetical protein
LTDTLTVILFFISLIISIVLNIRDFRRMKKASL